tara:strand:+ start:183 stop:416 length:234 start_codon:yes stop_codon:yes gene_type:complete
MEKITEVVVALLMILNGNIVEHTYKDKMSSCLKSKRIAEREVNPQSVRFACKKIKAQTEIYMGQKKILKIIDDMEQG